MERESNISPSQSVYSWRVPTVDSLSNKRRFSWSIFSAGCQPTPVLITRYATAIQLVALRKFGREDMLAVTASKQAEHLTICHLCGSRNCCEPSHLVLEPKSVNDERTYCHFLLGNILNRCGREKMIEFIENFDFCPHSPKCGRLTEKGPDSDEKPS